MLYILAAQMRKNIWNRIFPSLESILLLWSDNCLGVTGADAKIVPVMIPGRGMLDIAPKQDVGKNPIEIVKNRIYLR